jgi:uncharacterized protein (DUF2141 family)
VKRAAAAILSLCLMAGGVVHAASILSSSLRVTVDGVTKAGGTLRIGLHDEATFSEPGAMPLKRNDIANVAGDVSVEFARLPPGSYSVKAFQDLNNDGKWEQGEPQGISNDAPASEFEQASVLLMPGVNTLTVHLK